MYRVALEIVGEKLYISQLTKKFFWLAQATQEISHIQINSEK